MSERPSDEMLVAFLDGELDEAELASLEAWLEREPSLRARLKLLAETTSLVRESFDEVLREPVPAHLLRAASQPSAKVLTFRPRLPGLGATVIRLPQRWAALAAACVVCAVAAGGSLSYLSSGEPQTGTSVLDNIAGYHNLITASANAGENTVFDVPAGSEAKLPVNIRVPNLKPWGLEFQGAKKIVIEGGKPAYQFAYFTDNKALGTITVTLWRTGKPDAQPTFSHQSDDNLMFWRHAGLGCAIASQVANKGYLWNMAQDVAWQLQNG
jgi:anti-sigma factor RsiW